MSNFQKQKKQSVYDRDILIDFMMTKGYVGNMRMFSNCIELSNENRFVSIPNIPTLTNAMVISVLQTAELNYSDFEEHLLSIEKMKSFIDLGINTPNLK